MKIIDAHLHLFPSDGWAEEMAASVGHINSVEHLKEVYRELGIVQGVVMGNHRVDFNRVCADSGIFNYCVGLDGAFFDERGKKTPAASFDELENHLKNEKCCGIKLYPGYDKVSLSDSMYHAVYELAAEYDKPVAVHMGLTAHERAHLKYCHPMVLDEAAADFPKTRFVMCHFGTPFFETSAAVIAKNPNVSADLSGFLEGRTNIDEYFSEQSGYVFLLKTWLAAVCGWDRLMFGTDWPIVNLSEYIEFIKRVVPEKHWEKVFFENANYIYGLGL